MTLEEKVAQYKQAILEAEETLNNPHLPEVAYTAAEKVIATLSKKLMNIQAVVNKNN